MSKQRDNQHIKQLLWIQGLRNYLLFPTGWGPQSIAFSCQISGFMVDTTIVHEGYFMVYKPTPISRGPHLAGFSRRRAGHIRSQLIFLGPISHRISSISELQDVVNRFLTWIGSHLRFPVQRSTKSHLQLARIMVLPFPFFDRCHVGRLC